MQGRGTQKMPDQERVDGKTDGVTATAFEIESLVEWKVR
jgi:hypothetical protein